MKKRITALLLVLVLGLFLALPAAASQGVKTYGLVDDGADLLTAWGRSWTSPWWW